MTGKQTRFGTAEVKFGEYDNSDIEYGSDGIGFYVEGFNGYRREDGSIDIYPIGGDSEQESLCYCRGWEVVGNIHETPHLLKRPLIQSSNNSRMN